MICTVQLLLHEVYAAVHKVVWHGLRIPDAALQSSPLTNSVMRPD